jgi:hypothetical protein
VKSKCAVFLHCLSVSFSHLKIKQATMCETGKKSQSFIKTDTRRLNVLFSLTSKSTGSLCFLALTWQSRWYLVSSIVILPLQVSKCLHGNLD